MILSMVPDQEILIKRVNKIVVITIRGNNDWGGSWKALGVLLTFYYLHGCVH